MIEERLFFSFFFFFPDSRIFFGYNCVHLKILLFLQLNYYKLSPLITKMLSKWIQVRLLAKKLKALREDKSISIEELAQRSGLAIEQVERIENNIDIPSLAPLIKIARVLGVRLGTFLDDQDEVGPVVCRKKEAKDAISFSNNAIHSRKHMEYHSLSKSKADRHMEPFIIDVMPTEDTDFVLSSHEGEEFIMVMEGIMEISYGKNTYLLEEGDSIYYDSIVPHHVHAYEGQAAKILAVVYTPI